MLGVKIISLNINVSMHEDGDDYNAKFVLTDEGRAYLEQLKRGGGGD